MPSDALMSQTAPGVKTASGSTAGFTLPKATMLRPLFCRIIYNSAANASGSNAISFSVDTSWDNGVTWAELDGAAPINLSTTAQSAELTIPMQITRQDLVFHQTVAPMVRLTYTFTGAGSGATINITNVDFTPSRL